MIILSASDKRLLRTAKGSTLETIIRGVASRARISFQEATDEVNKYLRPNLNIIKEETTE